MRRSIRGTALFAMVALVPLSGCNLKVSAGGDAGAGEEDAGAGDGDGAQLDPNAPSGPICDMTSVDFQRLAPNVYITVDESGSMSNTDDTDPPRSRIDRAKDGLRAMATALDGQIRLGISGFSGNCDGSGIVEVLPMGDHSLAEMIAAIDLLIDKGGTPMHAGVKDIREQARLDDAADPHDAVRTKVAVLIGDGRPNRCTCDYPDGDCDVAVQSELTLLHDTLGVPTFIVGFAFTADVFVSFAEAGQTATLGPDPYYLADDGETLAAALTEISQLFIGCRFLLNPAPPDPSRIWVSINGTWMSADNFSYDANTGELVLGSDTCDELEALAEDQEVGLEIVMGCPLQVD
jgi:hypothetical protein